MMIRSGSNLVGSLLLLVSRGDTSSCSWVIMKKIVKALTQMGFNGEVLDLQVDVAKPQQRIWNEEWLINKILDENSTNSTGWLFKCEVQIAIFGIFWEHQKEESQAAWNETGKGGNKKAEAIDAFNKIIVAHGDNKQIALRDSKAILKYLLPILAPNDKKSD